MQDRGLSTKGNKRALIIRLQADINSSISAPVPLAVDSPVEKSVTPSLIVCPLSVLSAWIDQIDAHIKKDIVNVVVYHGAGRTKNEEEIMSCDIVLTTYDVLVSEYFPQNEGSTSLNKKRKSQGLLQSISWHRVILDEAHLIRNVKTARFKGCAELISVNKWCLTGIIIS